MSRQQIGNIVLPRQPPRPNMHRFDSFSLVRDSLPAHRFPIFLNMKPLYHRGNCDNASFDTAAGLWEIKS